MILIRDVKCKYNNDKAEQLRSLTEKTAKFLHIKPSQIKDVKIIKRSIDARRKPLICYNYHIAVNADNEDKILKNIRNNKIEKYRPVVYNEPDSIESKSKIYIIGAGPAGLFCGLILAKVGLKPIIIERGSSVEKRLSDVKTFWKEGVLKPDSNVQFGEGGAGTFSDGKLNTGIKDKNGRITYVLQTFAEHGANNNILYDAKPHIGTDTLVNVVKSIRSEIIECGGEFLFDTKLTKINYKFNKIDSIELSESKIVPCDYLCLAIGHSARDTFRMLYESNVEMTGKQFAVGLRIEHLQEDINKVQYGINYSNYAPDIEPAAYKLTTNLVNGRGVFSFCMCPGGYVVNASSEAGLLAVNGMSDEARDSENANSAIVVTVGEKEFDLNDPMAAIEYQRNLERKAYELGKGSIPIQLYKDYKENVMSTELGYIKPTGICKYNFANLNELFSKEINESIVNGIDTFGCKLNGFNNGDSVLSGVESRTSSPVRILRDDKMISNIDNIFPCGEGAGYAGGIMSAAVDGIKVAEAIIDKIKRDR